MNICNDNRTVQDCTMRLTVITVTISRSIKLFYDKKQANKQFF
jgi:hypothetical protein